MNHKNYFLFSFLILFFLIPSRTIYPMESQRINPTQTPLEIDLHDTFMTRHYLSVITGVAHLFWHFPKKWELAKLTFSLCPLLKEVKRIQKSGATGEDILDHLQKIYPVFATPFKSDFSTDGKLNLAGQINKMIALRKYYPNKELAVLLEELKKNGHPIFAVSNIGDTAFGYLKEAHKEFNIFDDKFIPSDAQKIVKENPKQFEAWNNQPTKSINKNNPLFYTALNYWLEQKNIRGTGYFIDDRKDYLAAAQQSNTDTHNPRIVGLHFTTTADIKAHLTTRGLLKDNPAAQPIQARAY